MSLKVTEWDATKNRRVEFAPTVPLLQRIKDAARWIVGKPIRFAFCWRDIDEGINFMKARKLKLPPASAFKDAPPLPADLKTKA